MKKFIAISLVFVCLIIFWGYCKNENIFSVDYTKPVVSSQVEYKSDGEMLFDNKYFSKGSEFIYKKANGYSYKSAKTDHCYQDLNPEEQYLYRMIKENAYKIYDNFDSKSSSYPVEPIEIEGKVLEASTIRRAMKAVQWDNPDIFWMSNTISFIKKQSSTTVKLSSLISPEECAKKIEDLSRYATKILSGIPEGVSEYDTELYIHDAIIKSCSYSNDDLSSKFSWTKFTALGPILYREAVCEGFSKAMKLLLCSAGVECRLITGDRGNERHMWNIVKVDSLWYHLDATWDSADEMGRYNYFNLSDDAIKNDHIVDTQINWIKGYPADDKYNFKLPTCSSMEKNYICKNALTLDSFNEREDNYIIEELRKVVYRKDKYLYILIGQHMDYNSTVKKLFSEKPYKFFYYISKINSDPSVFNKINNDRIYFTENTPSKVVTVELNYI